MGCNTSKDVVPTSQDLQENQKNDEVKDRQDPEGTSPELEQEDHLQELEDEDPERIAAVTKIQAAFRGHKTRKEMQQAKEPEPTKEELEAEFSPDDKELCQAATKIQASFRGHKSRKELTDQKVVDDLSQDMNKLNQKAEEEEELDIDLSDPDLHKAATKIQASFRGHKVRKEPKE